MRLTKLTGTIQYFSLFMFVMIMNRLTYLNQYYSTSSDLSKSREIRCQERNPWGSLGETFGKSIQIFTCQQNLERKTGAHIHGNRTNTAKTPECEGLVLRRSRSPARRIELILWNVYFPQKVRGKRGSEKDEGKKKIKRPVKPADSWPFKSPPPSLIPLLIPVSLEFKLKWKETVSCSHQGSSSCFFSPPSLFFFFW